MKFLYIMWIIIALLLIFIGIANIITSKIGYACFSFLLGFGLLGVIIYNIATHNY